MKVSCQIVKVIMYGELAPEAGARIAHDQLHNSGPILLLKACQVRIHGLEIGALYTYLLFIGW